MHLVSIDIRNNRLSREGGLKLAQKYDGKGPASMDWFLDTLGITEKEFLTIVKLNLVKNYGTKIYGTQPNRKK